MVTAETEGILGNLRPSVPADRSETNPGAQNRLAFTVQDKNKMFLFFK
jgi:hypothetical protein